MYIILPNSDLEQNGKLMERHDGYYLSLDAMQERLFIQGLIKEFRKAQMSDIEPVLLASRTDLRFALARLIQKYNIPMPVISTNELVPGMDIKHIATVEVVQENIV
jgi:flagellar biosynthesis component FlhA